MRGHEANLGKGSCENQVRENRRNKRRTSRGSEDEMRSGKVGEVGELRRNEGRGTKGGRVSAWK